MSTLRSRQTARKPLARTRAFALGLLGFSAVAVAWTSFSGTAYADAAPTHPSAAVSATAPAASSAAPTAANNPLAALTDDLGSLLGTTTATVDGVLTSVTTAPTVITKPTAATPAPATHDTEVTPSSGSAPATALPHAAQTVLPHEEATPHPAPAAAPTAQHAADALDGLPSATPLLGNTTRDVTAALTGTVTASVDTTAAPAADLLKSLLDATPVPAVIDATPVVGTTVHSLVATGTKTVDTLTSALDDDVSPTLGLLGIGVAPVRDAVDDVVKPVVAPLTSQTDEPATPTRPTDTLPMGPPATAPPVIPGVIALPTAPPKSSAIKLRTPRTAAPVPSGATPRRDAATSVTGSSSSAHAAASIDLDGLLDSQGTDVPAQQPSNAPAPVSTGGLGTATPALGAASADAPGGSVAVTSTRDHTWRLPVAPTREPGARPD